MRLRPVPRGGAGPARRPGRSAAARHLLRRPCRYRGLLAVTAAITPAGAILLARVLLGERLTAVRTVGLRLAASSAGLIAAAEPADLPRACRTPHPAFPRPVTATSMLIKDRRSGAASGLPRSSDQAHMCGRSG
jgi:hypothetical protein